MEISDQIVEAIFEAIEVVNEQLSADQRLDKSVGTPLVGPQAKLDSLGLVNFILAVEQCTASRCGESIILTDDEVMSRQDEIFATVRSLADYIGRTITERRHGQR